MSKQDQSYGEFEQLKDQLLTYTYSGSLEDRNSPKIKNKKIPKVATSQRPKMCLVTETQFDKDMQGFFKSNKAKLLKQSYGRILTIGDATFKSNFQCGNINTVEQIETSTYQITLEQQSNSNRMSIWFYFSCIGLKGQNTFIIKGFTKSSSLYNEGMKVCIRQSEGKWKRGGTKISYYQNNEDNYSLKFSYYFESKAETEIQFAYCFPYSYSKLINFIKSNRSQLQIETLTNTLEGRVLPLITIGNPNSQYVMFLSARVHPGETVSSFIMEGFLKQLLSNSQYSTLLKQNFLFKILPMINADGVAKGNYRFSASGHDLNRKWQSCRSNKHPEIFHWKNCIKKFSQIKKPLLFIDMHGHSRRKNVFFYGCSKKQNGVCNSEPKMFPYLMQEICNAYKFDYCSFAIQKDKEGTARITMWKQLKIDCIYTLQSTFCSAENGINYLQPDYCEIGKKLCQGIAIFFQDFCKIKNVKQEYKEKMLKFKQKIYQEFQSNRELREAGMDNDSGSDSQPEKGENAEQNYQSLGCVEVKPEVKFVTRSIRSIKMQKKYQNQQISQFQKKSHDKASIKDLKKQQEFKPTIQYQSIQNTMRPLKTSQLQRKNNFNSLSTALDVKKKLVKSRDRKFSIHLYHHREQEMQMITENITKQKEQDNEIASYTERINQAQLLRRKLLLDKGGAQYRRVRKLAEQTSRRKNVTVISAIEKQSPVVRGLQTNNVFEWQQDSSTFKVSPNFFPKSRSKNRAISNDMYMKKNYRIYDLQGRHISINGQQFKVKCLGKKVVKKY